MLKIFFAHPDDKLVTLYRSYLQPAVSIDSASDGLTALRKIRREPPSLIVSDYDLPLLSGPALLKFIRRHPLLGPTPFVFLTANGDPGLALSLGANDWFDHRHDPQQVINKFYEHLKINKIFI